MYDEDSDSYWPDPETTSYDLPPIYSAESDSYWPQSTGNTVYPDVMYEGDATQPNNISRNPNVSPADASRIPDVQQSSGLKNLLNKLTKNSKGELDYAKLAMLLYGAKTLAKGPSTAPKMGFQGTIPTYQATTNLKSAPPAGRRPGAYGINYGGDAKFTGMAEGGLTNLASGRYLQGATDGMADQIPAQIGQDQPAALSHGEFVIPADVVSHLGNGNSDAGAKKLYSMMDKVRQARTGNKKQGKKINPDKFMPGGLAQAYANGGSVLKFVDGGLTPTSGEQTLSSWAAPYVTDMLGKGQALSNTPYQAYEGQLTAGPSQLQTKVSSGLNNISFPGNLGSSFSSTGAYQPPQMNMGAYNTQPIGTGTPRPTYDQYKAGLSSDQTPVAENIYNQGLAGKSVYDAATPVSADATGMPQYNEFGGSQPTTMSEAQQSQGIASQYMNPYLKSVLDPQLAELRRQADITKQGGLGTLTKSGAFGGGRQAIMESEAARNLMQEMNKTIGQGYSNAYDKGMAQFNTEQGQSKDLAKMMSEQGMIDRGIEAEGIAADKAQFEEARANPYKQVQFQQSLLDKLPIQTTNYNTVTPSMLETLSGNMTTMNALLEKLGLLEKKP